MKKIFGIFIVSLSLLLVTGCENKKNSDSKNTITCIGSESGTKTIMTGTFENDKLIKVVREEQTTYNNDTDLNSEYSMANTMVELLNNTIDGIKVTVSKDGMTITIKATMDMDALDKDYKKDNNLNITSATEFKNMAKSNSLSCD